MATSQNGWTVVPNTTAGRARLDDRPLLRDVDVPNGVLAGDVAVVFRWLARAYDRRVERLTAGECWGWFVKNIEGSSTISNHASGTAVDFNAPDNPMGVPTGRSMTAAQIAQCHALERESSGVLRWGGDFSRPDPMHWEIVGTATQVAALADRIERDTMTAPTPAQIFAHDVDPSAGTYSAGGALWTVFGRTAALTGPGGLPTVLGQVKAELDALVADTDTDFDALAASLVYLKSAIDLLTADPAELGEAHPIVAAIRYAAANPPPA